MKGTSNGTFFSVTAIVVLAASSTSLAQMEGEYQLQPIFTRYAETVKKITFNATARVFNHVQLQESDHFDGWTVDADLTVPIPYTKRFQARIFWPFYTEGDARIIEPSPDFHRKNKIHGYGGVFDYANIELAYQFMAEPDNGFNASVYGGIGERQRVLWTTTAARDIYNHQGQAAMFGGRADWRCGDDWRFLANAGVRYYFNSDDLNPEGTGSSDRWTLGEFSVAAIYHPWKCPVYPVAELVYQTSFGSYNSIEFVPELIWAACRNFELKAGVPIGLTDDGESFGGRFQATLRF